MGQRNRLPLLLMVFCQLMFSQKKLLKGRVFDRDSGIPLTNVLVTSLKTNESVFTDANGFFQLYIDGKLSVAKEGFKSQIMKVISDEFLFVNLEPNPIMLEETIINGNTIPEKLGNATQNIAIIPNAQITKGNPIFMEQVLNTVPGVFVQRGVLNTARITIRGIGARSPFSTSKIRTFFGDIPLTDGNGESFAEDLELASVGRMEVHKGPSASNYGVGLGGAIIFQPLFSDFGATEVAGNIILGSYDTQRYLLNVRHGGENYTTNFVFSETQSQGYRENNEYHRRNFTGTSRWYLDAKNTLTFLGNILDLKAFIPSSLNADNFQNDPKSAATLWKQAKGFEDTTFGLFGVTWEHQYNQMWKQQTSFYGTWKDNYEPRPFNILKESSYAFGMRSRLLGSISKAQKLSWSLGAEYYEESYNGKKLENRYAEFEEGTGSVEGSLLSDTSENRLYYNFFGELLWKWNTLSMNFGLHYNKTTYRFRYHFPEWNANRNNRFFSPVIAPKFGIHYAVNDELNLFGNIAKGFSTPKTEEIQLPNGILNTDIESEIGWNYEIGSRFRSRDKRFHMVASLYTMRIRDLLVNRRTETDESVLINAGRTVHNGLETEMNYKFVDNDRYKLYTILTLSIHDYKFKEFVDDLENFSGNDITGVPSYNHNFELFVDSNQGLYGNIRSQWVGAMPVNDKNSLYNSSYNVVHSKIGYKKTIKDKFKFNLFLGIDNIFNTKYASQIQVNAFGNDSSARYFYPGLPTNLHGGFSFTYKI